MPEDGHCLVQTVRPTQPTYKMRVMIRMLMRLLMRVMIRTPIYPSPPSVSQSEPGCLNVSQTVFTCCLEPFPSHQTDTKGTINLKSIKRGLFLIFPFVACQAYIPNSSLPAAPSYPQSSTALLHPLLLKLAPILLQPSPSYLY